MRTWKTRTKRSWFWIGALGLLSALQAPGTEAWDSNPITLDGVDIHYKRFAEGSRNPYFLSSRQKEEINLNINGTVLRYGFTRVTAHAMTDENQYHLGGANVVFGLRLTPWLDMQAEHFSKHLFDESYAIQRFSVEDSVGVRLYLYGGGNRGEALLP